MRSGVLVLCAAAITAVNSPLLKLGTLLLLETGLNVGAFCGASSWLHKTHRLFTAKCPSFQGHKWVKKWNRAPMDSDITDCQRLRSRTRSNPLGSSSTTKSTMSPSFWKRWGTRLRLKTFLSAADCDNENVEIRQNRKKTRLSGFTPHAETSTN